MFKTLQEHCIFIYPCHEIGATLGPQLWYFGDGKRSHDYGHFTMALINNTACIDKSTTCTITTVVSIDEPKHVSTFVVNP